MFRAAVVVVGRVTVAAKVVRVVVGNLRVNNKVAVTVTALRHRSSLLM